MAIRIIEGIPGSGKSYYAVKHLADRYFEKQKDGRYELIQPITIITNIDSFQPEHLSLQNLTKDAGGVKAFFSEYYQKALTECIGGQIVYIIDEAQKWFRKGARDLDEVYSYFEYHRHFGHDIYLITQNSKKLPYDIYCLTEYIIVAAPRSRAVIGEFKYKWMSDGEILKREGFKPDSGIFALYKSMDQKEVEKISNPVMKTAGLAVLAVLFVMGFGIYYFKVKWMGGNTSSAKAVSSAIATAPFPSSGRSLASNNLVTVVVSMLTEIDTALGFDRRTEFVVFQDVVYPRKLFPHPLRRIAGQWWADVPPELIKIEEKEETRPGGQPEHASERGAAAHGGPPVVSTSNDSYE